MAYTYYLKIPRHGTGMWNVLTVSHSCHFYFSVCLEWSLCLRQSVWAEMLVSMCKAIRMLLLRVCQERFCSCQAIQAPVDLKWPVSQRFSSYVLCFHTSPASPRGLGEVLFKGVGPKDRHGPGRGKWYCQLLICRLPLFFFLSLAQPLSLYSSSPDFPTIGWGSSPTVDIPLSIPWKRQCLLRPLRSTHTHTHTQPSPFCGEVLNRQHNQKAASRLRH